MQFPRSDLSKRGIGVERMYIQQAGKLNLDVPDHFFIYKKDRRALILSAREMDEKEQRSYEKN